MHTDDDNASFLRHQIVIQRSRLIFYNAGWLIGVVAKLLGLLSFSWSAGFLYLLVSNLSIFICIFLYSRGISRVGPLPLTGVWMAFDTLIITWAIVLSGGSQSVLYPWYLSTAAAAAYMGGRRGLITVMIADTLAFLGVVVLTEDAEVSTLLAVLGKMVILFGASGYALVAIWRLQQKRRLIGNLRSEESRRTTELETAIGTISNSANRLAKAADELFAVSRTMTASAEDTAVQASSVSESVSRVTVNLQSVAAAVEELSYGVREISKIARQSAGVAEEAVAEANRTNQTVAKLSESSSEVSSIIETINSIAAQTRLLSLNATIEAARAGSAGRGFAIVASEVKMLADKTATATDEVGSKISAIQTDTGSVIAAIERISEIISQISELQTTTADSIEEQTLTTSEISSSISEAAQGGSEISHGIAMVAAAADQTSVGATTVEDAARRLTSMAEELNPEIERRDS
jgi:methyl-accepting chemotaxis protein